MQKTNWIYCMLVYGQMFHRIDHFVIKIEFQSCKAQREIGLANFSATGCLDQVGCPYLIKLLSNALPLFEFLLNYPL